MNWFLLGLFLATGYLLMRLDDRLRKVEERFRHPPELRAQELIIELKPRAIMKHPKCEHFYRQALERLETGELKLSPDGRSFIDHHRFRIVYQNVKMLWSDFHETFIENFELRGKLLNVETGGSTLEEPTLWLRIDGPTFQLYLIEKPQPDPSAVLISEFPIDDLLTASASRSEEEQMRRVRSLVAEVKRRGFSLSTWGSLDVYHDDLGKLESYDPDSGYVGFADSWVRVRYKESTPLWWGSPLASDYRKLLEVLDTAKPQLFE